MMDMVNQVSMDGELEAIFGVIKSSLMFNNSDMMHAQVSQHQKKENRDRLAQELTNYISLYIM